ncbi:MAG: polysaccharide export protein [Acetobacteraceae bacterium]|nr:polysaccharide export protein [Acetobacteraceae bacterium]
MAAISVRHGHAVALRQRLRGTSALRGLSLMGVVAALAACSGVPDNLPQAPATPVETGYTAPLPPYRIQVGDVLEVRLLLNPELNEEVTVRPDGHISTTVVQDEPAYGRTVDNLAAALRRDYSHDLTNPRVSVVVRSFAPTRVYVGGEVNTPGEFITVGPSLTLAQAIARAGGLKLSSQDSKIFIIRRGAGDKPEFLATRYEAVMHAQSDGDVRLAPYDLVYVPKSGIAEVYKWYNQYVQQFANPSFGFSYLVAPELGSSSVITTPAATTAH